MATLLKVDGTKETVTPANPETGFGLQELYKLLGVEMIEVIHTDDGILVFDEEGKFRQPNALNEAATALLHKAGGMPFDYMVGNVLICNEKEFQ